MNFSGYLIYENTFLCVHPSQNNLMRYESTYMPHIIIPHEINTRLELSRYTDLEPINFKGEEESLLIYLDIVDLLKTPTSNYQLRLELLLKRFFQVIHIVTEKNIFDEELTRQIEEYIDTHLHDSLKIPELAKRFGLNQQYLKVKFKNTFESSIHYYIRNKRLDYSISLLHSKKFTMSEIAAQVGYATTSSFSQAFKIKFGKSPMQYKISKN